MDDFPVSYSALERFLQCSLQWWAHKYKKVDRVHQVADFVGIGMHEVCHVIGGMKTKSLDSVYQVLVDRFNSGALVLEPGADPRLNAAVTSDPKAFEDCKAMLKTAWSMDQFLDFAAIDFESKFDTTFPNGVRALGYLDRVDIRDGGSTLVIVDYKTGNYVMSSEEARESIQSNLYIAALRNDSRNPKYQQWFSGIRNIAFEMRYLRSGDIVYIQRSDQELDVFIEFLGTVYHRMKNLQKPVATPNLFCSSCQLRTKCKPYKEMLNRSDDLLASLDIQEFDVDTLSLAYDRLTAAAQAIKKAKDGIASRVKTVMRSNNDVVVPGRNQGFRLVRNSDIRLPQDDVLAALRRCNVLELAVDASKSKLERLLPPDEFRKIMSKSVKSVGSTYIRTTKNT